MLSLESLRRAPSAASPIDELLGRLSVGELLRLLTPRQRSIVVAYFYLDQSQEQIAELLGIRRGTVAATISQALARMREGEGHVQGTARPL
ncbi:MAG: sigma factor-like helix-turn-helix DNA-binding protein [Candidatus Limnocylindria bacterium]